MSEYAVHFTKGRGSVSAYNVSLEILWSGEIKPTGPLGAARNIPVLGESQKSACFSEIPLDLLDRLVTRRSSYGLGFTQETLIDRGGGRVWYLDKDGPAAAGFQELIRGHMLGGIETSDSIWKVTPFVDYPGEYGDTAYRFEWEREWRVPRGLRFAPDDVAFLFLPEQYHEAARGFFKDALEDGTGPAYLCPYLDPRWPVDRLQDALRSIPVPTS